MMIGSSWVGDKGPALYGYWVFLHEETERRCLVNSLSEAVFAFFVCFLFVCFDTRDQTYDITLASQALTEQTVSISCCIWLISE